LQDHDGDRGDDVGTVLVGVDGSAPSRAALGWAADEARLRTAVLKVVYVYEHTPAWQLYGYGLEAPMAVTTDVASGSAADDATEAASHAQRLVDQMVADLDLRELDVQRVAYQDRRPARALVELSRDADVLVLGSRGRGGFAGLVLGSVSQQCINHAYCPVVVLPHHDDPAEPRDGQ
jgi:nucleotide-binding universal stress UspA family protein